MANDYAQLWKAVTDEADGAEAVRILAKILADKEGEVFISRLERDQANLFIQLWDDVSRELRLSPFRRLTWYCQAATKRVPQHAMNDTFLVAIRRLAEHHVLLPDRLKMPDGFVVSPDIALSGGEGSIRRQELLGKTVAVKIAKIPEISDTVAQGKKVTVWRNKKLKQIQMTKKVSINTTTLSTLDAASAILFQRFYREAILWSTLSHPNVLKLLAAWEKVEEKQLVSVGVDDKRDHHELHSTSSRQQTRSSA